MPDAALICPSCSQPFPRGHNSKQRYCSDRCRQRHYDSFIRVRPAMDQPVSCLTCDGMFRPKVHSGGVPSKYCSPECRSKRGMVRWRGTTEENVSRDGETFSSALEREGNGH